MGKTDGQSFDAFSPVDSNKQALDLSDASKTVDSIYYNSGLSVEKAVTSPEPAPGVPVATGSNHYIASNAAYGLLEGTKLRGTLSTLLNISSETGSVKIAIEVNDEQVVEKTYTEADNGYIEIEIPKQLKFGDLFKVVLKRATDTTDASLDQTRLIVTRGSVSDCAC